MKKIIAFLIRFVPRKYLQRVSGIGLKMLGLLYTGNKVECPICHHRYRIFLPYGRINPRSNALCPSCQSLERHRLIWLYLQKETNFFQQQLDVLHIAPESCFLKRFGQYHGNKYITADIESPLAKVKMDIHHIPFAENTFDVVLCNHVLEHVKNDIAAMREIFRVLRPGGIAILQVPFFSPIADETIEDISITDQREREKLFGQADHVRKYGKDYINRIDESGLKGEANKFAFDFSVEDGIRYGINTQEVLYIGRKS